MPPSRRSILGFTGTSTLGLLAGCSASGLGGTPGTETAPTTTGTAHEPELEVRLHGPETDRFLFDDSDVASVGEVEKNQDGAIVLPVTLSKSSTTEFSDTFRSVGVAEDPDAFELVQFHDGSEVRRLGISPQLARKIEDGEWDGRFVMTFENRERATAVRELLVEGETRENG